MEIPRQEYRSGLPFPSPSDLPHPGIKPASPALAGRFFATQPPGNPQEMHTKHAQSLGWEDPLEKEMATPSSTLAWRIPGTEEPGGLQSMGSQESDTTELLSVPTQFCRIYET